MRRVVLPNQYKPKTCSLERIGSKFDGGYLVPQQLISNCEEFLSLGANYDINLEKQLNARKKMKMIIVDASVSPLGLFKSGVKSLLLGRFWVAFRYLFAIPEQFIFRKLHKDIEFRYEFVGSLEQQSSFSGIIDSNFETNNVFVSCDIEGNEYRILDEILDVQERLCGLVIEFHDCDIHRKKIEEFIRAFALEICHIHVNNCGLLAKDSFPTGLEITFSRYMKVSEEELQFPNLLDAPCDPKKEDLAISFECERKV